jgi:lysophospholipase L1-like esterase
MIKAKKAIWNTLFLFSAGCLLLLATGFVFALNDLLFPAGTKQQISKPVPMVSIAEGGLLLGLGDSLTRGIGDPQGMGYLKRLKNEMEKNSKEPISLVNLAISGQTSSQLAKQIKEPSVTPLLKKAKWITLTIGGNDLFRGSGRLAKIDLKAAQKSRQTYEKNLDAILTEIRKHNANAPVFLFGLYNPFGDLAEKDLSSRLVQEWNQTMIQVAGKHPNVIVVPTFDLFQLNPKALLSSDHFHPNEEGYKRMAQRLLQVISPAKEANPVHVQP